MRMEPSTTAERLAFLRWRLTSALRISPSLHLHDLLTDLANLGESLGNFLHPQVWGSSQVDSWSSGRWPKSGECATTFPGSKGSRKQILVGWSPSRDSRQHGRSCGTLQRGAPCVVCIRTGAVPLAHVPRLGEAMEPPSRLTTYQLTCSLRASCESTLPCT